MNQIKIIYIASSGRSGSTILEMLLGLSETNFAVGEIHLLGYELTQKYQKCGCGMWVSDCGFWSKLPIEAQNAALHPTFSLFREKYNAGKAIRLRILLNHFFKIPLSRYLKNSIKKYNDLNYEFFSSLNSEKFDHIEGTIFVDSSKDSYRLWTLLKDERFDLKIVHLVKSPDEFSFGATKKIRPQTGLYFKYRSIRLICRWFVENYIIYSFTKCKHLIAIDYNELATNTDEMIDQIAKFAKFRKPKELLLQAKLQHGIAGNMTRNRSAAVTRDHSWKYKIPKWKKFFANFVCGILYKRILRQK